MGILHREIELAGSKGRARRTALFDSGATYSMIGSDIAKHVEQPRPLPEDDVWEFETAEKGHVLIATHWVSLAFYFDDSRQRFTDEFIVMDGLSEEVVIGAKTMQAWKIKLDFETEEIIYRKTAQRLIII